MVDTLTKTPSTKTADNQKEKLAKSWENKELILGLLMRNHPIAYVVLHKIFNNFAKKENTGKALTDGEKHKSAFTALALGSLENPKLRSAIQEIPRELQQLTTEQPRDLQTRTQAAMKDLGGRVGELFTTPRTMLFSAQRDTTSLAALVPKATPESLAPESTEQARKRKLTQA